MLTIYYFSHRFQSRPRARCVAVNLHKASFQSTVERKSLFEGAKYATRFLVSLSEFGALHFFRS